MSIESVSRALNVEGVTPAERLVLIGIANHDGDGGAWPSMATLARYACVSIRSVQRTIRGLEDRGLVTVEQNAGGTLRTPHHERPNRYVLHLGPPDTSVAPPVTPVSPPPLTPVSPEPSLNHPYPPTPRKRRLSTAPVRELRNYDMPTPDAEEIMAKYGVTA